jgi:hypothetical protein
MAGAKSRKKQVTNKQLRYFVIRVRCLPIDLLIRAYYTRASCTYLCNRRAFSVGMETLITDGRLSDELERIWRKTVVTQLFRYLFGGTKENHGIPQSG